MKNETLVKLAKVFEGQQKVLEKLASQKFNWDVMADMYSQKLSPVFEALEDAAEFLEQVKQTLPGGAAPAIDMRIKRLRHFRDEIVQLQDDIHYGIKPAVQQALGQTGDDDEY